MAPVDYDASLSVIRNHVDGLGVWLAIWVARDDSKPQPQVRGHANDAMDAVDAVVRELHGIRSRLLAEIRDSDDVAAVRADALLRKVRSDFPAAS